jgi:KRAB domain-containing zinc finger protein
VPDQQTLNNFVNHPGQKLRLLTPLEPGSQGHKCQFCLTQFAFEADWQQHACVNAVWILRIEPRATQPEVPPLPLNFDDSQISHECRVCGLHLKSAIFLNAHIDLHSTPTPGEIKCAFDKCNLTFSSSEQLKMHTKKHFLVPRMSCDFCGRLFIRKINLRLHIQKHANGTKSHSKKRLIKCDFGECLCAFNTLQKLLIHKDNQHKLHDLKCTYCNLTLTVNKRSFKRHLHEHKTIKPNVLKCLHLGCQGTFSDPNSLKVHVEQRHEIKCNVSNCLFTSSLLKSLQKHRIKVHDIWPYNCQMCGKGIDLFLTYCGHMKRHKFPKNQPKDLKCMKIGCQETFASSSDLMKHVVSHNLGSSQADLNPSRSCLECHLCGRIFKMEPASLLFHVSTHETNTPGVLKCVVCKKLFTSATDLREHADQRRHSTKRVACCAASSFLPRPPCSSTCASASTLGED